MRVLISDKADKIAQEIFKQRGIEVDVNTGLQANELIGLIGNYDGLVVRSATKVTAEVIQAASKLKVVGRAGTGVDNIDLEAASKKDIVVMNTPGGNTVTTAEHAIAMMMALARMIPQANISMKAGKWEKKNFMGTELRGQTLAVLGLGAIGKVVADRALGLKMNVISHDPFISVEEGEKLGVKMVSFDQLLQEADFLTIHVKKSNQTTDLLDEAAFAKMKKGISIVNCSRGGIVNEQAMKNSLDNGTVKRAAIDVYMNEPAPQGHILVDHPAVICTPHIGASTREAQIIVADAVARQISDYLLDGKVVNCVNR